MGWVVGWVRVGGNRWAGLGMGAGWAGRWDGSGLVAIGGQGRGGGR